MCAAMEGDACLYRGLLAEIAISVRVMARGALSRAGVGDADVEDIVQETLLAIHLKRETWDRAELLAPWVFAIARHKIVDALRRRGVRRAEPIEYFEETLAAPETPDPQDTAAMAMSRNTTSSASCANWRRDNGPSSARSRSRESRWRRPPAGWR